MFTSSQLKALDASHHLSVTANAGSGKTMVLVERYLRILLSRRASVSEVVAITFTDKAASELRWRIAERVASRILETADRNEKRVLEEIRDQLSGAVIGTIHWFCSTMLREYPVEAGVDAAFVVPELVDQRSMLDEAVKETFDSILKKEPGSVQREQVFGLLRALGKSKVLDTLHALVGKREMVERWVTDGPYAQSDDFILAYWRTKLTEHVRNEIASVDVDRDLQHLLASANGSSKQVFGFEGRLKAFMNAVAPAERLRCYVDVMDWLMTKTSGISRKIISEEAQTRVAEHAERLERRHTSLAPLLEFVQGDNDDSHRLLLKHTRVLLDLYQNVVERYEQKKIDGAYLDFDDLQFRARNLLKREDIRRKLSQRFKFIMVDEFQDTNVLQYEILLPLVNDLRSGNLFIVGDPKQSIYGFRDADVAVFRQTKNAIAKARGEVGAVVLNDSFRLLRDVAAFVNMIFSPLMHAETNAYEVGYEELVRGRQNDAPGRVEILLREQHDEDAKEESVPEGEMIARRILQLHDAKHQVFDNNEKPRHVRFADFAILLRSRNGLSDLEEAFIQNNIPYLVSAGIGYFQTQGIYDFYNYFRFLLHPEDDTALAGILRSPFFNVSDAELFEIAYRRSGALWQTLSHKGKTKKPHSIQRAVEILKSDLELASRLSVPELVNRIIDESGYAGVVEGTARAEQILANLEKLKRIARRYEQQGFTNLYDFVGRLKRLIEEEEEEGQATVDVLADTVKIMTIHAAKGLEFPIVILPSLERTFQHDREPYGDHDLGIGFTSGSEEEDVPIVEFLRRESLAKSRAEEKRVFYVACTRARDMLILSGAMPKSRASHSYMHWMLNGLGEHAELVGSRLTFAASTGCLQVSDEQYVAVRESHQFNLHILRKADLPKAMRHSVSELAGTEKQQLLIEPIVPKPKGEMFSASKIRTYIECPAKYYLRYVIGLPVPTIRQAHESIDEEDDAAIPAELRGRAFHYIMEHIDELTPDVNSLVRELRDYIRRDSLSILSEPSIELEDIAQAVVEVVGSRFWSDVALGRETRKEFTMMTPLGDDFLTGTLDRLYRDAEGIWHILDYKTDAVSPSGLRQKATLYEAQLRFYGLLVRKLFSADRVHAHLLFTSSVNEPVDFVYRGEQLDGFEHQLREIVGRIRRRDFPRATLPCHDCPFSPEGCRSFA